MNGIASTLSDEQMVILSKYYASQVGMQIINRAHLQLKNLINKLKTCFRWL